ncbi:gamma-glutamylcyclotransferase [Chenggangzhangella methanolivorans]|uniref:glutathione-specific gamma-glutamylcyclotransferase n=1 Tax=Chenggangzhangella methanolivorans TaxID=1437009 RepID=A0A9E6RBX1_9HYPH|nr:gamma-glutamylcyclotransferase [Chenggangzhangella methanolivorans]QZO01946.1 gamma-glutamylcyclotransferase [Chenggangzhangella methanolivorans]
MTDSGIPTDIDLWVFAYGSLMWRPGFEAAERSCATVDGYHRALCIESHRHRGTPERPGLVLGLDEGGSCCGVAFRVEAARVADTLAYLRERELVTRVYLETMLPAKLQDGRTVEAVAYVVDRDHPQYVGLLSPEETLERVAGSVGLAGPNPDYVVNTARELDRLGVGDPTLSWLAAALTVSTEE